MARRRRRSKIQKLNSYVWTSILGLGFLVLAVLMMASFLKRGAFLIAINQFATASLGAGALVLPFIFLQLALVCFQSAWIWSRPLMLVGGGLFLAGITGITSGGSLGGAAATTLASLITRPGASLFFLTLLVAGMLVLWQVSLRDLINWWQKLSTDRALKKKMSGFLSAQEGVAYVGADNNVDNLPDLVQEPALTKANDTWAGDTNTELSEGTAVPAVAPNATVKRFEKIELLGEIKTAAPALPLAATSSPAQRPLWQYPSLSLLDGVDGGEADRGDVNANAQIIENTLESFGIKARVVEVNRGPSVTQYALEIAMGTKLSKITGLATDLALALAAPTGQIRVEAPIAGKSLVGVEVPNRKAAFVTLRKMLGNNKLKDHPSKLAVALGIDVNGKQIVGDIAKMPHVLIAGATGSGKSVGINSFLCSLLFRCSPEELRLILVDPKRVELTMYQDIPHLLTPVIVEAQKAVPALKWACDEMDRRYRILADNQVRNIAGHNAKPGVTPLPNIIIVIDEFADVIMFAPNEVEEAVTRIAQMARAVGIHLVLTTQRPSVNVITGLIKANIPTRIAFNVASIMDSRVILDTPGAEKLLGNGDMLYIPPDQAKPIRIQGTFVSDVDANHLTTFLKTQGWAPDYIDDVTSKFRISGGKRSGDLGNGQVEERDEKFAEAARMFLQYDTASSSMIQRRLGVGYARAARILDQLCEAGLVGPANGSKPREVNRETINIFLSQPDNA